MSKAFPFALAAFAVAIVGLAVPVSAPSPAAAESTSAQTYVDPRYADSTTVAVEGTLQLAEIETLGDRPADDSAYAVTTSDGSVVPVTLTKDLPANSRFEGRLVVGGGLAKALDRKGVLPSSGRTIDGDSAVGRTTVATAEDQGTPVPVAAARVTGGVVATTPTPASHRAYVVKMVNEGSVDGSDASIGAAVDKVLSYWTTESSGAITSFTRVGKILDYRSVAGYTTAQGCGLNDPYTIWNDAKNLFPSVDFNLPGNHLVVLVGEECGSTGPVGVAQIGSSIASGGPSMLTYEPQMFASVGTHELGHNFGLQHANLDTCSTPSKCAYFDLYSPMALAISGASLTPPALGTLYRTELGLTSASEVSRAALSDGQTSLTQTYALAPRASASGRRGLLVTDPSTGTTYSVDWRSRAGRDAGTFYGSGHDFGRPLPAYAKGVVIERQSGTGATYLMTRNNGSSTVGSFGAGDSFKPSSRLSISVGTIGTTASVRVTIASPTVVGTIPTVSGTSAVGRSVTAASGTWTGGATLSYDWRVDGVSTGSKGPTFVIPAKAVGKALTVAVTGRRTGFTSTTKTSTTSTVAKGTLVAGTSTIRGTAEVGRTLEVTVGTWAPTATTIKRQWYADGTTIPGATGSSLKLKSSQRGKKITVKVTGSSTGYETVSRSSTATTSVVR